MSSGRVHYQYGSVVLAGTMAAALGLLLVEDSLVAPTTRLSACLGLLCGSVTGLILTPDTDLKHNYSRWRLRRRFPVLGRLVWLWFLPFSLGRHRGLSHTVWGTLLRWAWTWWLPLVLLVVLAAYLAQGALSSLAPPVVLFLLAALLGQGAQDTVHLLLDR